jgi:hypothetical protein
MTDFVNIVKTYGATGLLAVAVWWQNSRITDIEQRLHNCYEARIIEKGRTSESHVMSVKLVAVLPKKQKFVYL